MKTKIFTLILTLLSVSAIGQQLIDFEDQLAELDTFKNGQSGESQFIEGPILFPNEYDHDNDFWSGQWAMSSSQNNSDGNFLNLYGCIDGGGSNGSEVYGVGQKPVYGGALYISSSSPIQPNNVHITNTTYAYNVIENGNQFSKAFGGPTGDDPDYFYIEWSGYLDGQLQGTEKFYLADYRFTNNSNDYIIGQWTQFDLSNLGVVDRIEIEFYSSDTGQFGINTPTFFAIDNFEYSLSSSSEAQLQLQLVTYPNPAADKVFWKNNGMLEKVSLVDLNGRVVLTAEKVNTLDVSHLQRGVYILQWSTKESEGIGKLIKN